MTMMGMRTMTEAERSRSLRRAGTTNAGTFTDK